MSTATIEPGTAAAHMDPRSDLPRWLPAPFTGDPVLVDLSPMLVNVLESLCEGKSNQMIADDWGVSEDTVKTHLKRLYVRLGARDRVHAVSLVFTRAVDVRAKPARHSSAWSTALPDDDFL